MEKKKQKTYTPKEALIKAAAYCAYQERTQQEVRSKLFSYGLEPDDVEEWPNYKQNKSNTAPPQRPGF